MNIKSIITETAENIFDDQVLTDTFAEELLKSVPLGSLIQAFCRAKKNSNEKQKLEKIIEFIKEGETLAPGTLLEIFKNQNDIETGLELLNALEKCYLVLQSKMLARSAILYDSNEINRDQFLRYAHIIPQFTSYLLEGLEKSYEAFKKNLINKNFHLKNNDCNFAASELEKLGFLSVVTSYGSGNVYSKEKDLIFFYENIFERKDNT